LFKIVGGEKKKNDNLLEKVLHPGKALLHARKFISMTSH